MIIINHGIFNAVILDQGEWEDLPGQDDTALVQQQVTMVLVVNTTLNMRPGKVAAQVCVSASLLSSQRVV